MEQPLISVIIPVYNAAVTIERCVKSIVAQKAEIEIICVDDGSTDGSYDALNELASKDERIMVIHQNNSGAGSARNAGINASRGEYIMFCDADDSYLPDTIDKIAVDIYNSNPDLITFHRRTMLLNGEEQLWGQGEDSCLLPCDWEGYLNDYLITRSHGNGVVNKVFRREIILNNAVKFRYFRFGEDLWFLLTYAINAKKFYQDYSTYYLQYQTSGSICLSSYISYYDMNMEWVTAFKKEYPNEAGALRSFFSQYCYGVVTWSIYRILSGIDASTVKQKKAMCMELFSKDDVQREILNFKKSEISTRFQKKRCKYILGKQYYGYAFMFYYSLRLKSYILSHIRR